MQSWRMHPSITPDEKAIGTCKNMANCLGKLKITRSKILQEQDGALCNGDFLTGKKYYN